MSDDAQLLEFPCTITLKVIGNDEDGFSDWVVATVAQHAAGIAEGSVTTRPSRSGRYLSVSVTMSADSRGQLEAVYRVLSADDRVSFVL